MEQERLKNILDDMQAIKVRLDELQLEIALFYAECLTLRLSKDEEDGRRRN